jgi:hypothetical protein
MESHTRRCLVKCVVCVPCSRPRFVGGSAARDRTAQPSDFVPPARAPLSKTRSAAAASFAQSLKLLHSCKVQSGGAKSGDEPDKAGADLEERQALVVYPWVQVRRTPLVPPIITERGLSDGALFDSPEL